MTRSTTSAQWLHLVGASRFSPEKHEDTKGARTQEIKSIEIITTMHLASKSERSSSSNHECKQLNEIQNWLPNFINRENITWSGKSANYNPISLPKAHELHLAPLIYETTIITTTTTRCAINRPEYAATCCNRI
jgi:hypothetical protein